MDSSRVKAMGYSRVVAWDFSRVEAWDYSHVTASDYSRVKAMDFSHVVAKGYSRVEAWDHSHVTAMGYSRVEAWESSVCDNRTERSEIMAGDNSTLYLIVEPASFEAEDSVNIIKEFISPSFEQGLSRGWVIADGIRQKLVSKKTLGNITIYTTEDFWGDTFYVAQLGNKFSHGETVEEAKDDLRYKISERDKSHYEGWTLETKAKVGEMIEAYRVITGSCFIGTKMFCEGIKLKDEHTVNEVIEVTKGQYGNDEFSQFFESKKK